jgi:hypothetical protein
MNINKFYLYKLRNDVHFQFYTGFHALVQRDGGHGT